MSYLLCHHCYTWVEPDGCRCPDCYQMIDPADPDPDHSALQTAIGQVVCCLGEVRLRRRHLPDLGLLYATTNGLLFLPHAVEELMQVVEADSAGASLLWTLAAVVWTPLAFMLPLVRTKRVQPRRVAVYRPRLLSQGESRPLPRLLMDDPGVFFLARSSIHLIKRGWRGWRIERRQARRLGFRPESEPAQFHARLLALTALDGWRDVMTDF